MKPIFVIIFCMSILHSIHAQEILKNETIIKLVSLGLDDEIILNKIGNTYNQFNVETDNLINLKNSGVSNTLINGMMNAASDPNLVYSNPNDFLSPHIGGIYYFKDKNLIKLEFTPYSSNKKTGKFVQDISYGFAKTKKDVIIGGSSSRQKFNIIPEFYFYAETSSQSSFSGYEVGSPNAFVCVKLDVEKNSRKLLVGSSNRIESESGINHKQQISYEFEEMAPGIYRVWFIKNPDPGEYAFMHSGQITTYTVGRSSSSGMNRAFDFTIVK